MTKKKNKTIKLKFEIIRGNWQKLKDFGLEIKNESGFWYIVRVIFSDGDRITYKKAFKTFSEAITICGNYIDKLEKMKIIDSKDVSKAKAEILGQEEKRQKAQLKPLHIAASITTLIGTPLGIGISAYSTLTQRNKSNLKLRRHETISKTNKIDLEITKDNYFIMHIHGDVTELSEPYLHDAHYNSDKIILILNFDLDAYWNSGGIKVLINFLHQVKKNYLLVAITGIDEHIKKIFKIVGIIKLAKIYGSVEEAKYKTIDSILNAITG